MQEGPVEEGQTARQDGHQHDKWRENIHSRSNDRDETQQKEKKVVNGKIIIRVDRSTITNKPPLPITITPPSSNKS